MHKNTMYDILSLNVRGIRDQLKRRSIFAYLKDHSPKIIFLQETYSEPSDEMIWKSEWGGEIFFSHGTKHSKGVCILIHPTMQSKIDCIFNSNTGRMVLIAMEFNSLKLSLCNVYAPNNQSEQLNFLQELNNVLMDKSELSTLIVGGDWNCTLAKKDKVGGSDWKPSNYRNLLLTTMEAFDLVDIQRVRHPQLRKYSYVSKALKLKSRIDFFLVAQNLTRFVKKSDIYPSVAPDHQAIYMSLLWRNETPRGPGLWKFNNTLLDDDQYLANIRETYVSACDMHSAVKDKRLFWEMLKMEFRSTTISYSKNKSKLTHVREEEVKSRLEELDRIICNNFNSPGIDPVLNEYDNLKAELQSIYEKKGRSAIFRSKCRWVEEGERPTKYFFNLEKKNYNKKTITELHGEDGTTINNEKRILDSIEKYYSQLYKTINNLEQKDFDSFMEPLRISKLKTEDREEMEGPLSVEECKKTLDTFEGDKTPGEDGFTVEFYKIFFDLIGQDLVASFNAAYEVNELSISQRRRIVTLIPKEEGSLLELQNWRPITLLNVDCKIATKAIAKRIEPYLPTLIHSDETGFIKGRYIGENIRLIEDVMEYTKVHNIPGILIALDFKKAFDSLEWGYIMNTLDAFNFGTSIKRWISTFYSNIESAVINNGFLTNWFKPSRGVRQGCPLSPFLFILSAELLANKIRQDTKIKGIKILENEIKLSQFADDTNLFCADLETVKEALKLVDEFGRLSGLTLNVKKSKAMWLGKWEKNKNNPLNLKWMRSPMRILGVHVSYNERENNELNFNLKMRKMQTNLDIWRARNLTLFGKVMIIKSLGLSQLVYSASTLNVPGDITSILKTKLFSYLWNNKKDKIKREGLYQDIHKGGMRMVDIEIMFKALKLAWIPKLLSPGNPNWKTIPDYYLKRVGGLNFLLRCNYDEKQLTSLPVFYRNILKYFRELKTLYKHNQDQNIILHNNKDILVGDRPFFIREWSQNGILSIQDLLTTTGQLMSYQDFLNNYQCKKTNFLHYYQVTSAIPKYLLTIARKKPLIKKELYLNNTFNFQLDELTQIDLIKIRSRDFYKLFNTTTHTGKHKGPQKWDDYFSTKKDMWKERFASLKTLCKEPKLKEFQFKFIHRIIVTKRELFRYGIQSDDDCVYCGEQDSIEHTFSDCPFVKKFSHEVISWFNVTNKTHFNPSMEEKLFGVPSEQFEKSVAKKFNYTLLFMKYYIYTNKLHTSSIALADFVNKISLKYRIECIEA